MDEIQKAYETKGIPYFIPMTNGTCQTLIGLNETDYRMLLMKGFKDEEVYLSLRTEYNLGPDYDLEIRAGLNTIKMEGDPLFQLRLDKEETAQLRDRGFRDGAEVDIKIKMSPYRIPSAEFKAEDVDLHVFDDTDPILDDPEVWLQ